MDKVTNPFLDIDIFSNAKLSKILEIEKFINLSYTHPFMRFIMLINKYHPIPKKICIKNSHMHLIWESHNGEEIDLKIYKSGLIYGDDNININMISYGHIDHIGSKLNEFFRDERSALNQKKGKFI